MAHPLPPDPYIALGVPTDAGLSVIRSAYRKLALQCHPDRIKGDADEAFKAEAGQKFRNIQDAYETLRDDTLRTRYDERVKLAELRAKNPATSRNDRTAQGSGVPTASLDQSPRPPYNERNGKKARHIDSDSSEEENDFPWSSRPYKAGYNKKSKAPAHAEVLERRFSRAKRTPRDESTFGSSERSSFRLETPSRNATRPQRSVQDSTPFGKSMRNGKEEAPITNENQALADLSRAARKVLANQPLTAHRDTIEGLEGFLNEYPVRALADTGADQNFIAQAFVEHLQCSLIHYSRDARPSFLMGHGRQVHATAHAKIRWQFRKEPGKTYDLSFYVLPDCIFDVMIGGAFLYATSTMTLHRNRLSRIPRPRRALNTRVVNLCGTPSRRLNGVLHTEKCRALPDSGAEPNLLSYEYVKQRGWLLDMVPGPESCTLLQFADGSTETTEGRLHLKWSFDGKWDVTNPSTEYSITFDVLRGCPFDVILGQDFLDHTSAFSKYIESFQDIYHEGLPGLNLVFWADCFSSKSKQKKKKTTTNDALKIVLSQLKSNDAVLDELERRAEADRCIARIINDPPRKPIEMQKERRLRSQWDAAHPSILQPRSASNVTSTRPRSSDVSLEPNSSSRSSSNASSSSLSSQTSSSPRTSSNGRSSKTSISSDASGRSGSNRFTDSTTLSPQRRGPEPLDKRHPAHPLRDAFLKRKSGKTPLRSYIGVPDAS